MLAVFLFQIDCGDYDYLRSIYIIDIYTITNAKC